jgi:restriction endonuclease Mrr
MARTKAHHKVSVLDLIDAGMLAPGDEITFEPRKGEVYTGQIGRAGELVFDGKEFSKPSSAASTLAGNSLNGWEYIKVKGRPLSEYRQQVEGSKHEAPQAPPPRAQPSPSQPPAPPPPRASLLELIRAHLEEVERCLAQRIADLSADQFEQLVAEFLTRQGYSDVRRVGGPGDRNVDVAAAYRAPSIRFPIRVQVKHRRAGPNIGPSDVAAFRDRAGGPDHTLLMVTNVEFTDGSKETASEQGRQVVHLIDGKELVRSMIDKRIGAKEGPMGVLDIDEDFWGQF